MTNPEFENEFDVLYNNITSNQAPGLDAYEKSVFLTKALDQLIKDYFNPRLNKTQEGFDGSERRQIDFSMIMRSVSYINSSNPSDGTLGDSNSGTSLDVLPELDASSDELTSNSDPSSTTTPVGTFGSSFFDGRDNTKSVLLDNDILMFVNEYVVVKRGGNDVRLIVLPINYTEYSRLMSKPFKRPIAYLAWRLLDNSNGKRAEIIIGPNDILEKYVMRYVKRPRAIRLIDFTPEGLTIDGESTAQECELDPILHLELLQRAVELAKAAYTGDLNSTIALGTNSQTPAGMVAQSK